MVVPARLAVIPWGEDLNAVEVGMATSFVSLSTLALTEGDVRTRTCRLPFFAVETTLSSRTLNLKLEFPPAAMGPPPLMVYGPPCDDGVERVNPLAAARS